MEITSQQLSQKFLSMLPNPCYFFKKIIHSVKVQSLNEEI